MTRTAGGSLKNRIATKAKAAGMDPASIRPVADGTNKVLGFALEVGMVAALLFWGFKQESPWHLILGLGVPAVVVVFWGAFMAPRSERRLSPDLVRWLALGLFLAAALALLTVGSTALGIVMLVLAAANFAASLILRS
ncbi:YrdB family protein [Arthrobacter alpinus]|uniref:YrdB family protein n=1 Tax=Arthrobacter alpinus TaxID=656366 RepID=UPI0009447F25|nr:YrdB family protein [Arthrobacter alpinus]